VQRAFSKERIISINLPVPKGWYGIHPAFYAFEALLRSKVSRSAVNPIVACLLAHRQKLAQFPGSAHRRVHNHEPPPPCLSAAKPISFPTKTPLTLTPITWSKKTFLRIVPTSVLTTPSIPALRKDYINFSKGFECFIGVSFTSCRFGHVSL